MIGDDFILSIHLPNYQPSSHYYKATNDPSQTIQFLFLFLPSITQSPFAPLPPVSSVILRIVNQIESFSNL